MRTDLEQLVEELRAQRQVLNDLHNSLGRAKSGGKASGSGEAERKNFLALLSECLDKVRRNRNAWLGLDPAAKENFPEITELLRESQNLILKILVLDREREVPPHASASRPTEVPQPSEVLQESSHLLNRLYGPHNPS